MIKIVNRKGQMKSSLIFDEFPTIYLNNIDNLMATARSNKVATTLGVQDFSQLKKDYGKDQADVIMNIAGNIISGQVMGDTAKQLSDRFGKTMQLRGSLSINRLDTSITQSRQLEIAIPPSKIVALSSGEFVGIISDNPNVNINLKSFHSIITNNYNISGHSHKFYKELNVIQIPKKNQLHSNFAQIKQDIELIMM